ncbi:MAG: hypothetical protein J6X31_04835 [Bacteroidales bacterium]|nr:hypothetical protein [Bacteroidales bacterium]MBP5680350.1 hypothetical protein [Bacteroidales bacterium]
MKYIERIAYVLMLIAILIAFNHLEVARYLASVGAAGIAIARFKERYNGTNLRLKRLTRLRHLVGVAYVVGAGLMFRPYNYWLIAFAVAVVLELYTIFVIEHEEKKQKS